MICRHFKIRHILSVLQALLYTFWARIIYILIPLPVASKEKLITYDDDGDDKVEPTD